MYELVKIQHFEPTLPYSPSKRKDRRGSGGTVEPCTAVQLEPYNTVRASGTGTAVPVATWIVLSGPRTQCVFSQPPVASAGTVQLYWQE